MADLNARIKKDRIKEIVAYSVCLAFWLGGLALCILGVYAFNAPIKTANNSIFQAQKDFTKWLGWSKMIDFRILGAVICLLVMCVFLAFINHFANRYEKDAARRSRQEAKLHDMLEADKKASEAIIAQEQANRLSLAKEASAPTSAPAPSPAAETGPRKPEEEGK